MIDFFLSSLFWASIILACFVAILVVADWIITWQEYKKMENQDD
jgi:hypothetical protein